MFSVRLFACSVLLVVFSSLRISAEKCIFSFPDSGTSFNLQTLQTSQVSGWSLMDNRRNAGSSQYSYNFNFCSNLGNLDYPPGGFFSIFKDCNKTSGRDFQTYTNPAPVFQIPTGEVSKGDECHRLGGELDGSGQNIAAALIDSNDPSVGMTLTYKNGDACPRTPSGANVYRSFSLQMRCAENTPAISSLSSAAVVETSYCTYTVYLENTAGCPLECPRVNDAVCGGKGVCRFDRSKERTKCFCFPGYKGGDCQSKTDSGGHGISAVGVVLILVSLVAAGALVFLYFMWQRVRGLRLDMTAYRNLGGEDALVHGDSSNL